MPRASVWNGGASQDRWLEQRQSNPIRDEIGYKFIARTAPVSYRIANPFTEVSSGLGSPTRPDLTLVPVAIIGVP